MVVSCGMVAPAVADQSGGPLRIRPASRSNARAAARAASIRDRLAPEQQWKIPRARRSMIRIIIFALSLARLRVARMLIAPCQRTKGRPVASASTTAVIRFPNPTFCVSGVSGRVQWTPLTPDMRATAPSRAASSTTVSPTTLWTP